MPADRPLSPGRGMAAGKERSATRRGFPPRQPMPRSVGGLSGRWEITGCLGVTLATFFLAATRWRLLRSRRRVVPSMRFENQTANQNYLAAGHGLPARPPLFPTPLALQKRAVDGNAPTASSGLSIAAPREIGGSRRAGNAPCRWPVPWPIRFLPPRLNADPALAIIHGIGLLTKTCGMILAT